MIQILRAGDPSPVYGLPLEIKPIIRGIPDGARVRLRLRPKDWARAFCKTPDGIREFIIIERPDGNWELGYEQGRNYRP